LFPRCVSLLLGGFKRHWVIEGVLPRQVGETSSFVR
jgi:hypothetical protein